MNKTFFSSNETFHQLHLMDYTLWPTNFFSGDGGKLSMTSLDNFILNSATCHQYYLMLLGSLVLGSCNSLVTPLSLLKSLLKRLCRLCHKKAIFAFDKTGVILLYVKIFGKHFSRNPFFEFLILFRV